jgi:hypothetical protein
MASPHLEESRQKVLPSPQKLKPLDLRKEKQTGFSQPWGSGTQRSLGQMVRDHEEGRRDIGLER